MGDDEQRDFYIIYSLIRQAQNKLNVEHVS